MSFKAAGRAEKFALVCNDEVANFLSNSRSKNVWAALEDLVKTLGQSGRLPEEKILFAWEREPPHCATAKEAYGWRAVLEEIKNADLTTKCIEYRADPEKFVLITDKPTMLKVAGEVTNSLLHSNTSRHKISFVKIQSAS